MLFLAAKVKLHIYVFTHSININFFSTWLNFSHILVHHVLKKKFYTVFEKRQYQKEHHFLLIR